MFRLRNALEWAILLFLVPGVITMVVRGSHVDIRVRLCRAARMLNYTGIGLLLLGLMFCAQRVVTAFTSGRVAQVIEQARQGHPCAAIGDPPAQAECIKAVKDALDSEQRTADSDAGKEAR